MLIRVNRLSALRDLVRGRQLQEVILKLLGFCVKVKVCFIKQTRLPCSFPTIIAFEYHEYSGIAGTRIRFRNADSRPLAKGRGFESHRGQGDDFSRSWCTKLGELHLTLLF